MESFQKLISQGIIRESFSLYCSRVVPIFKTDCTIRICADYRELNNITVKNNIQCPE